MGLFVRSNAGAIGTSARYSGDVTSVQPFATNAR